ncbi:MAG: molybdopterin-guanine dinucleotide biosynthesis protein B [Defluviitaleaceae bacterium]|nr:molybdopterin-guanine dinucleotide biosynthesis protein B [Defluviitaleaceae bacterium]
MEGHNKSFLVYENQTFINRILDQLKILDRTLIDEILISVGTSKQEYEHLTYTLVEDEMKNCGPLGGIYAGLKYCQNEHLFVCATDMPKLQSELIEFMAEFVSSDYDCFVFKSVINFQERVQPLCAIYKKSLVPLIEKLIGEGKYSLHELCAGARTKYIPMKYSRFDESVLVNINFPSDFSELTRKKPIIFAVSGVKNSGKTTLITKLIASLKIEGYRIGVIKHDGHEFEIDIHNTDTYLFRQAGSDTTLIYSQTKLALIKTFANEDSNLNLQQLINYFDNCDIVIVEGLKHSNLPKIEVVLENPICNEEYVMVIATDSSFIHEHIPTFSREDIPQIIAILKKYLW